MSHEEFEEVLKDLEKELGVTGTAGLGGYLFIQAAVAVLDVLEEAFQNPAKNPFPRVIGTLRSQTDYLKAMRPSLSHIDSSQRPSTIVEESLGETRDLFEKAWTIYDSKTYSHSIELIRDRLLASGYDSDFFKGKRCYDGGCGTGRFAIAMAQLGAQEVVGADIGGESIEFAKERASELGVGNIQFVVEDVTDLSNHPDESFDVVISNGVLHHAPETERGIKEHFRITRRGGLYWLYLYGKGGIYWEAYDRIGKHVKKIPREQARNTLLQFGLRLGFVYTFLDNICAPIRKYYSTTDTVNMLRECGEFNWKHLKGTNPVDDTNLLLESAYGAVLLGAEGEVRIAIDRT